MVWPARDNPVSPLRSHNVARRAGGPKRLVEEIQETFLVRLRGAERLLKDVSEELQPLAVIRIIAAHP